ncbi:hypothetical protein Mapa_013428 [Marchantia paleacea]|nr:hypothetical protein Mapa_013428 [Marchantia paleacea]
MRSLTTCLHAMAPSVGLDACKVLVPRGLGSFGFHEHPQKLRCCRASRQETQPPSVFNYSAADGVSVAPRKYPPLLSVAPMMDWTDNYYRTLARLMTRCSWLYTEMVVAETIVHQAENLGRFLDYPANQHPIALQIGGSNLVNLAKAAQLACTYGYDEINLNCGCPSDKVAGHGCFGASLMLKPELVGQAMAVIADNCDVPVTVKCRIGVDNYDTYEELCTFIETVSSMSPTEVFVIHARKAILKGLSPAENRTVPPLKYEYAYALIRDFPHLKFVLNGGITSILEAKYALDRGAYGVMIGRAAYNCPWTTLGSADSILYGEPGPGLTRRQILEKYAVYADSTIGKYGPHRPNIRTLVKPLVHLFHAEPGASRWRRAVDETLKVRKTVQGVLEGTLQVLPDYVLDAPPPVPESPGDSFVFRMSDLPKTPSFLERSSPIISLSGSEMLQEIGCR